MWTCQEVPYVGKGTDINYLNERAWIKPINKERFLRGKVKSAIAFLKVLDIGIASTFLWLIYLFLGSLMIYTGEGVVFPFAKHFLPSSGEK